MGTLLKHMRIGIDISQIVYEGTGVATYMRQLVRSLVHADSTNTYVLFGASLRRSDVFYEFAEGLHAKNVTLVSVAIPPILLDILWNIFHVMPIERFVGPVDIFWSSDWTQPPLAGVHGVTTIHDLTTMRFPKEMDRRIVATHARRLRWVKKECATILCDSNATKQDIMELLHIPEHQLHVVYPGFSV